MNYHKFYFKNFNLMKTIQDTKIFNVKTLIVGNNNF